MTTARWLVEECGAVVDAVANGGWTPLYIACANGHEATVRLLLERGAAIDKSDDGETPLHIASSEGHVEVVRKLLERGADKELLFNGSTALDLARAQNHEAVCALLDA